jgi:hypothetical protein
VTLPDPAVRSPSLSNVTGDERTSEATKTNCCRLQPSAFSAIMKVSWSVRSARGYFV